MDSLTLHDGNCEMRRWGFRASPLFLLVCVGSLASFVVSLNLHRRHLDDNQRAMVAGKIANLESSKHASPIGEAVTQPQAAEMLNVSTRAVSRAKQVLKKGTPETIAAVESGKLTRLCGNASALMIPKCSI